MIYKTVKSILGERMNKILNNKHKKLAHIKRVIN